MDIRELLRYLQTEASDRSIGRALGMDRRTVSRYRHWATSQGLLEKPLPSVEELQAIIDATLSETLPPQNVSTVEPYREAVLKWRQEGVEIAAIHQRLSEQGYSGDYMAVYRFVKALEPATPETFVRVETLPGEEAQVDFGYAGYQYDPETGKQRKAWVFVMTLSWSRHQYAEVVFDQQLETWIELHRHALAFFGGVPQRVVVDNLKAAITQACWDNPEVQATYRECAEHYGFLIAPCRPRTPQHKGKVEQGGVHYVKRNFFGGREPAALPAVNAALREWCLTTAGQRTHGTTKEQPLQRFQEYEQAALQPLPAAPYDLARWKVAKVQRDGHVTFEQAYYSVPCALVGQQVRIRGGSRQVRIYDLTYHLLTTHERATTPGERVTKLLHLPPEKVSGLLLNRETCVAVAQEIGPATAQVVQHLLEDPAVDRLRTVIRLLHLRERYTDTRLEAACAHALQFDDPQYLTIKRILQQAVESPTPTPATPAALTFARSATELLGHVLGGVAWN